MVRLVKPIPSPDPGEPDSRSATRYILWLLRIQLPQLLIAGLFGSAWMASIAALPGVIGYGIDHGVAGKDTGALVLWSLCIIALAIVMATMAVLRHRMAVFNFLTAAYRTVQVTTRHATRVGAVLPRRIATGEVVSVGGTDPTSLGTALDVLGRTIGSVVTFIAVAFVLLNISPALGAVILIGLPVQALIIGPLLKPLQNREHAYREQQGKLTSRANDIVAGLRVLRGIGGEGLFADRYDRQSQEVKRFGFRVATASAIMKGLQVLLPGLLLVAVTWMGANLMAAGQITTGELVAVFGYTSFLMMPMSVFLETARKYTQAHAAARRVTALLRVEPSVSDTGDATVDTITQLADPKSGLAPPPGSLTAIACTDSADGVRIIDRLARYTDSDATADGVRLDKLRLDDVRKLVMVCDNDAFFFAGRLRDQLDPHGSGEDDRLDRAVHTAVAGDAVDSIGGYDGRLEAEARNISGGQRQRLRLARALLAEPQNLYLVEPTSAVDAHTEALIAQRLRDHRAGQTTVVVTTSPLMLEQADQVCFIDGERLQDTGTHRRLMDDNPRYRALISRETDGSQAPQEVSA